MKTIRNACSTVSIGSLMGASILLMPPGPSWTLEATTSDKLLIYCTNNLDGTGQCFRLPDYALMTCTVVPTSVFPCTDVDSTEWNCQYYGASQFQCKRAPRIQSEVDSNQFRGRTNGVKDFPPMLLPSPVNSDPLNGLPATINSNDFQ